MELTIDNIAVLYFLDYFAYFKQLDPAEALKTAGLDRRHVRRHEPVRPRDRRLDRRQVRQSLGLRRPREVAVRRAVLAKASALMLFSQATTLTLAIPLMITFACS